MDKKGRKIGDLSIEEFRALIVDVYAELTDPDYGLELKDEVIEDLLRAEDEETFTLEEVMKEFECENKENRQEGLAQTRS